MMRSIQTSIWSDPWFETLEPPAKLVFMYLITNEKTNMLGIYEASTRKISYDTAINKDEVEDILNNFEKDGKIRYKNNYLIITNFLKNQKMNANRCKSAMKSYQCLPSAMRPVSLLLDYRSPQNDRKSIESDWKTLVQGFAKISFKEEKEMTSNDNEIISPPVDTKPTEIDRTIFLPENGMTSKVEEEREREREGEKEIEGHSPKMSISPILNIETFESLTAQRYAAAEKEINQLDRAAIVEIGKSLNVKMPRSMHQALVDKLFEMTDRLENHQFWKEKRHSLTYLDKNFRRSMEHRLPRESKTTRIIRH